jgi:4-hydroxy-L-threonine phosphate dehydrogenase PdxA
LSSTRAARSRIAVPFGDPNGIGPEIALKAALDATVRDAAIPVLVGDAEVANFYADRLGCRRALAGLVEAGAVVLEPVAALDGAPAPGEATAAAGRATIAYACRAIALARDGAVEAVVAGPHNETAVARAGISFSGYPGLLAQETGTDPQRVFLMLIGERLRIVHVTLHMALRAALDAITAARVLDAARAADRALKRLDIAAPRIAACGINPHAGEDGLFGDDDRIIVRPAVEAARAEGIAIEGPFGADVLLAENRYDAYLAMYHDQGHIPIKLAGRGKALALSIGTPVLFSTVAHGSAHDIAGTGTADASALKGAIAHLAGIFRRRSETGR